MSKKLAKAIELPSSLLIDPTKQPLRMILPLYKGITHVPSEITNSGPGLMVFIELNKCFQRAGYVAAGLIGDLIWGFEQVGYDKRHIAAGITQLRTLGYLRAVDGAGNDIHELFHDPKTPIWVTYSKKFLDLMQTDHGQIVKGGVEV